MDFDALISKLDLATKVNLLTGADMWSLPAVPGIGLKRLVMSDGPIGVRGEQWSSADPSIAMPSPTALAATWDVDLVRKVGGLLAQEARRKGVHVLLAPTINLHRSPLGGRHFECFSEDVHLTGEIGAAYVEGVQGGGVATTPKHFVANDFETDRFTVDVKVTDKVLREVYLRPFERVVGAGAWGLMTSYNSVNGTTMSEHSDLVNGVLKREWGFDGFVVSDWTAVRSTEPAAVGGTDVAMPGPNGPWGEKLEEAVREGRVPESVIDDKVRRILRLAHRTGALGDLDEPVREEIDGIALAREVAARSFTLLKNDGGLLPLAGVNSLALIGSAADEARIMGGGSAQVFPDRIVSPLQGLSERTVEVRYALGTDPRVKLSPIAAESRAFFLDASGEVLAEHAVPNSEARWVGQAPSDVDVERLAAVEIRTAYTADAAGEHQFSISGVGRFTLTAGDTVVFDDSIAPDGDDPAVAFLHAPERRFPVTLDEGERIELTLRQHAVSSFNGMVLIMFTLGHANPTLGEDELIAQAVATAASSDVAVVVASTTLEVESEGFDRKSLKLPGRQDELIAAVAAANPRTIVVVNAGSPVEMPWLSEVAAVLLTWFPGQEAGLALADVLYGDAEPGGRLPTTWPVTLEDCPVVDVTPVDGAVPYTEGVFIGYRAWARGDVAPAFWFGHGLGYTEWGYNAVEAGNGSVTVSVTNTGSRRGREVVQAYVSGEGRDRTLAAFDVIEAGPGETVVTTLFLPERAFQEWEDGAWHTANGSYTVEVGRSYADIRLSDQITL
ncbi:glycoside hydrolase family 3 protein [Nonomuraea soli]|uniref:Beta-glucosidase n=1 Tax=Nonomuraea soli TaxID=1032476 RepID=A0A7W0CE16_9ACTN|nr:glycoside hydrolase family 3 C-terminal domain-containing protein [Nonomuraea soli]MBA2889414.1 beta-glucosidase [Nonomuraea soli]